MTVPDSSDNPPQSQPQRQIATVDEAWAYAERMAHETEQHLRRGAGAYWEMGTALRFIQDDYHKNGIRKFRQQVAAFGKRVGLGERALYNAIAIAEKFKTREEVEGHTIKSALAKDNAKGLIYGTEHEHNRVSHKTKSKDKDKPKDKPGDNSKDKPDDAPPAPPQDEPVVPDDLIQKPLIETPGEPGIGMNEHEVINHIVHALLDRASRVKSRKGVDIDSIERLLIYFKSLAE